MTEPERFLVEVVRTPPIEMRHGITRGDRRLAVRDEQRDEPLRDGDRGRSTFPGAVWVDSDIKGERVRLLRHEWRAAE